MSEELVTVDQDNPKLRMAYGRDLASLCGEIVKNTSVHIGGSKKKHVVIEAWQTIAAAWGCTPEVTHLEELPGGVRAEAILKRDSDGYVLSRAFGYCANDEKDLKHAVEGMAQTRAMSRVCANKFRFVVTLIDPNLSTTPAEEMAHLSGGKKEGAVTRDVAAAPSASLYKDDVQELEGIISDLRDNGEWVNGRIKGILFGTKKAELKKILLNSRPDDKFRIKLQKKVYPDGKERFFPIEIELLGEPPVESDMEDEPFYESNEPQD